MEKAPLHWTLLWFWSRTERGREPKHNNNYDNVNNFIIYYFIFYLFITLLLYYLLLYLLLYYCIIVAEWKSPLY